MREMRILRTCAAICLFHINILFSISNCHFIVRSLNSIYFFLFLVPAQPVSLTLIVCLIDRRFNYARCPYSTRGSRIAHSPPRHRTVRNMIRDGRLYSQNNYSSFSQTHFEHKNHNHSNCLLDFASLPIRSAQSAGKNVCKYGTRKNNKQCLHTPWSVQLTRAPIHDNITINRNTKKKRRNK